MLKLSQNPSCVLGPDGKWGLWSPWSACTSTCGEGSIARLRLCNNPPPQKGGKGCTDSSMETRPCNNTLCPSEYSSTFLLYLKCSSAIMVNIMFVCSRWRLDKLDWVVCVLRFMWWRTYESTAGVFEPRPSAWWEVLCRRHS